MSTTLAKVKVVLTALPLYLVALSTIVGIFAEELAGVLPGRAGEIFGAVVLVVLTVLTAAINIIRRVTPVIPADRGLLPTPPVVPQINVDAANGDA